MTTTHRPSSVEVEALRNDAKLCGVPLGWADATKLLTKVGSRYLVMDALLMAKRPDWLTKIVGPKAE